MNILGINGSPRKGGNTDILLDRALEGARNKGAKTEKIFLITLSQSLRIYLLLSMLNIMKSFFVRESMRKQ